MKIIKKILVCFMFVITLGILCSCSNGEIITEEIWNTIMNTDYSNVTIKLKIEDKSEIVKIENILLEKQSLSEEESNLLSKIKKDPKITYNEEQILKFSNTHYYNKIKTNMISTKYGTITKLERYACIDSILSDKTIKSCVNPHKETVIDPEKYTSVTSYVDGWGLEDYEYISAKYIINSVVKKSFNEYVFNDEDDCYQYVVRYLDRKLEIKVWFKNNRISKIERYDFATEEYFELKNSKLYPEYWLEDDVCSYGLYNKRTYEFIDYNSTNIKIPKDVDDILG